MVNITAPNNKLPETNEETRPFFGFDNLTDAMYPGWSFHWGVHQGLNPEPFVQGKIDFTTFARTLVDLQKLERQHRDHLAAVSLDPTAQRLLNALDNETSIRWEDIPDRTESDWVEASRSAALLVGANLCEVSPTRIRLNEYGDNLLAESSFERQALSAIAD